MAGVPPQAVSKWESGGSPDVDLLPVLADFFGVSIDILFGRNVTQTGPVEFGIMKSIISLPRVYRMSLL
ncbi:helix-turn-helix transcriptional regulator [Paenibacillus hemerocallicola]|uniref:Helix-turn-helix transcriptional regulator n=1 Tax=Paenibacillus hemerocallicola TaxID=1172614 RepID=A0A5C4SX73_9BACL|nr:helix-turn-helix transcriptional regulator [Paenibacillus hemerocallicola]